MTGSQRWKHGWPSESPVPGLSRGPLRRGHTDRPEFLNIGVVLFCSALSVRGNSFRFSLVMGAYLERCFRRQADLVHLRRLKRLFEKSCEAWVAGAQQPELFKTIENLDALLGLRGRH